MQIRYTHSPEAVAGMTTAELRAAFLVESLFQPGLLDLTYWEIGRTLVGSAVPLDRPLALETDVNMLAADYFLQRWELGVINIGGLGSVETSAGRFDLAKGDALYAGRGTEIPVSKLL